MALEVGSAYVDLVPRLSKTFARDVEAGLAGTLKNVGKSVSGLGDQLTRSLTLPIVAGLGLAANKSNDLQKQLREVVTLTGATGTGADALFTELATGVAGVSRELGIAQDELTGGLYQALSAGVPKDNVFEFLEVAGRTAVAGVTDIETSVDGLTTVINAFGLEADEVGAVSDSMFTAVKGGKTTFDELSSSLFQVAPIAGALGVQFTEVNAALAALTAQGTPTSVATTQLRAVIAELGKSGTAAATIFEDLSGKTFAEFTAGGGTLEEALAMMSEEAGNTGTSMLDMFGSVEAGQAALGLTGENAEAFAKALDAQADSAGATQAAFDEIDKARTMDRFGVLLENVAIVIGNAVLPALERLLDKITPFLAKLETLNPAVIDMGVGFIAVVAAAGPLLSIGGRLISLLGLIAAHPVIAAIALIAVGLYLAYTNIEPFREAVDQLVDSLGEVAAAVLDSGFFEYVAEQAERVAAIFTDDLLPAFLSLVGPIVDTLIPIVRDFAASIVAEVGGLVAFITERWDAIKLAIEGAINVAMGIVLGVLLTLQAAWDRFGDDITRIVTSAFDGIRQIISGAIQVIKGIIDVFIGVFTGDWRAAWEGIKEILGGVWEAINGILDIAFGFVAGIIGAGLQVILDIWDLAWMAASNALRNAWETIKRVISGAIGALIDRIRNTRTRIAEAASSAFGALRDAAASAIDAVVGFFTRLPGRILGTAAALGLAAIGLGGRIVQGLVDGLGAVVGAAGDIATRIGDAFLAAFSRAWDGLADLIESGLQGAIDAADTAAGPLLNFPDNVTAGLLPRFHDGGMVPGYVGEERLAVLTAGERVISRRQAGAPAFAGGGSNGPSFTITEAPNAAAVATEVGALLGWLETSRTDR